MSVKCGPGMEETGRGSLTLISQADWMLWLRLGTKAWLLWGLHAREEGLSRPLGQAVT